MKVVITGGTGLVGRFVAEEAFRQGHEVTLWSRSPPKTLLLGKQPAWQFYSLDRMPPALTAIDLLIHCAFDHVPGRYRGGEGSDPDAFRRRNEMGSMRLVQAAGDAGCRVIFLSSRAVYGAYPPGTVLTEEMEPRPDTLYGEVKLAVEEAVTASGGVSLRATGVYGPPGPEQRHKWADLFDEFAAGHQIVPRKVTEVHGTDLARACLLAVAPETPAILNVSDIMLDRRELLELWSELSGVGGRLPEPVTRAGPAEMDCTALRALGWWPRGRDGLRDTLAEMAQPGSAIRP